jgi:methyl-accepting chemotaxis protein
VKTLANQTANATEEIIAQVAAMRGATQDVVQAIGQITATITAINQASTTIAPAVEEQGAATQEIARNVHEAAQGTGQVSSSITGVNRAASETGAAAGRVLTSADELGTQATSAPPDDAAGERPRRTGQLVKSLRQDREDFHPGRGEKTFHPSDPDVSGALPTSQSSEIIPMVATIGTTGRV